MKRKQNGMTIIEILISILLITIVVTLLFGMLIQVKEEDIATNTQSNFLLSQSIFTKTIEEDAVNYGIVSVSACNLAEAKISSELLNSGYESNFKCIKIKYGASYTEDNIGFIMIYNTYEKFDVENGTYQGISDSSTWMIQYLRGHYEYDRVGYQSGDSLYNSDDPNVSSWTTLTQTMRSLPSEIDLSDISYINYTAAPASKINGLVTNTNAANLVIPIKDLDGVHYDINVAFTFDGNDNFTCNTSNESKLSCRCKSNSTLCQNTYRG
jgi:hypothetical protein